MKPSRLTGLFFIFQFQILFDGQPVKLMTLLQRKPNSNMLRLAFFIFAIATLPGCESPDSSLPATSKEGSGSASRSSQITSSSPEVEEEAEQKTDDNAYVVPGINFNPPPDDAAADGWQTEELSSAAAYQLKQLALHFAPLTEQPKPTLEDLVAPDVTFESLRPTKVTSTFSDAAFTIRRSSAADESQWNHGIEEFDLQLSGLLNFANHPRGIKTKVKVFKVDHQDAQLFTSAYMQTWGDADEGTIQSNATWDCVWEIGEKNVLLKSLAIKDYLEVVGSNSSGGGPMFADCTAAVLGETPAFQKQLLPGMDQWLHTIEIQYHINIGGWEGVSIADVNGDGLDDLYLSQPGGLPNRLFIQNGDGTCRDASAESGTDWLNQAHGSVFGDIDNDGDQDLVVGVQDGVLVMSNDGRGKFTVRRGLILPAAVPYSLSLADYDQDGDLDLFTCCYDRRSGVNRHRIFAKAIPYHDANNGGRNVLFRNDATPADQTAGPWKFSYVTKDAGLDENNRRFSYAASWEDYDNDGDLDLYIANDFGRNNLYRNDGGRFKDVAQEAGVEDVSAGMSITWSDYNNDGWMDIYVSNMFSSAGNRIAFQRKFQSDAGDATKQLFQRHARGNSLFENAQDGTFRDVSVEAGVTMGRWAWGSRFIDINNDGWQDILVANGFLTQAKADDL